jgi:hypothetical protein
MASTTSFQLVICPEEPELEPDPEPDEPLDEPVSGVVVGVVTPCEGAEGAVAVAVSEEVKIAREATPPAVAPINRATATPMARPTLEPEEVMVDRGAGPPAGAP